MAGTILTRKLKTNNVRAQLQLTQQQLANRANITRRVITRAEAGLTISRITAFAMLNVFNAMRKDFGLPELEIDDLDWKIRGDDEK